VVDRRFITLLEKWAADESPRMMKVLASPKPDLEELWKLARRCRKWFEFMAAWHHDPDMREQAKRVLAETAKFEREEILPRLHRQFRKQVLAGMERQR
jgi:hypothetical protein